MFWIDQILYKITIMFTKLSILTLYVSIFVTPNFRRFANGMRAIVICYGIASLAVTFMECFPTPALYDPDVKPTQCINLTSFWYANAIYSIVTDIVIVAMPLPVISRLRLPMRARIGLGMIFGLGVL